ncbi:alpha-L-rhamnosidase-related protein [Runella aurantiaca]|uniref:Glycogen debranching protein n=1 Tax=Runella aurantiaca TaxID=2282308 RepID=A0A369I5M3_9BACT|nr:family 78 glycoside hydrolase catalytic domain [Runella aurantiaca]RDB05039.1 glycogen debranching protein [Runella aurantiaca]
MMKHKHFLGLFFASGIGFHLPAQKVIPQSIAPVFANAESITGRPNYLDSPFNTAGDRLYMVGHQNGTFPDLGWHVKGEMGGIWHHPIKLMDGFEASVTVDDATVALTKADTFVNYPFGNKHIFNTFSEKITVERLQFVADGKSAVYVEFLVKNKTNNKLNVTLDLKAISNLMPVWLGERTGMVDGKDAATFRSVDNFWVAKDALNPWYAVYGSSINGTPSSTSEVNLTKPNVSTSRTQYTFEIAPNGVFSFPLIIAGSSKSEAEAIQAFKEVRENAFALISKKKARFEQINQKSRITLNDKELETAFRWVKYNTDWLIVDVADQGRGVSAGLPDYPWWFGGDMVYTLKGLIATGQKSLTYSTIDLIQRISEKTNGNGRIVHEVSTNGAVFNPGNVNETPQFVSLIWEVFCWTGDRAFLNKYFLGIEKGLDWLIKENDKDGNSLPDGFGMMEIHGMNSEMIDVAAYSQKGFADAAQMAAILGKNALAKSYQDKADLIKAKINKDFWVEEFGSYADFIGTKEQALHLVQDAIVRADTLKKPWAVKELKDTKTKIETYEAGLKKGFVMHHNWVVNTPMEMGIADKEKAIAALETAKKFTNPFGMFVTGIDRDETAGTDEGSFAAVSDKKIFTYTGAVMTLPTGVQAVAENNYGRPNEAYNLLKKMTKSFSYAFPGSIYEVSPDYGMMTQAWNMYAFGEPIIKQFFGIKPLAHQKKIRLSPLLPAALTEGKVENVAVGTNEISVVFKQTTGSDTFNINQKSADWNIVLAQPKGKYTRWILNGKPVQPDTFGDTEQVSVSGNTVRFELFK